MFYKVSRGWWKDYNLKIGPSFRQVMIFLHFQGFWLILTEEV